MNCQLCNVLFEKDFFTEYWTEPTHCNKCRKSIIQPVTKAQIEDIRTEHVIGIIGASKIARIANLKKAIIDNLNSNDNLKEILLAIIDLFPQ